MTEKTGTAIFLARTLKLYVTWHHGSSDVSIPRHRKTASALTPAVLETATVAVLIKKLPPFMEPEGTVPFYKGPLLGHNLSHLNSAHIHTTQFIYRIF